MPDSVEVSGIFYKVHTEHPYWFRFAELIEQKEGIKYTDFDCLYINKKTKDRIKRFESLYNFFYEAKPVPRVDPVTRHRMSIKALDYKIDADLIYSAILEQYKIDLMDKGIHWHKVRAMIDGLHGTKLDEIIGYRCFRPAPKNYDHDVEMFRLQNMWALPTPEDDKAKRARNYFNSLLGKK